MHRRWIVALVLATALVFSLAGTALGYWVIPESKGESGYCLVVRGTLEKGIGSGGSLDLNSVIEEYDERCR